MNRARSGGRAWIPAAVLGALCAGFFEPLLAGQTFTTVAGHYEAVFPWRALGGPYRDSPQSDQADLTFPWRTFIGRELSRGTVPFWNPHSFGGQPFYANGSSGILYPPNLIASLTLTPDRAHDMVSVLHVLLSGVFMYLLLREWKVGMAGALVSATAWMLSAFNLAWLHLEVVAPVSTWLPASVWLAGRAMRRRSLSSAIAAAAALACALISGHLLFGGVVFGVAMTYAAGLAVTRLAGWQTADADPEPREPAAATVLRLAVIGLGPFVVAGVVLVPTLVYLTSLARSSIAYEAVHESIRVPLGVFGHLLTPPPLPLTHESMHSMVYIGALPPLLAVFGLARRGPGRFFSVLAIVGIFCLATDTVLLKWAYAVFPPISFFSPLGRLLNIFNFGVAALAGMGFDLLSRRLDRSRTAAAAAIVIAVTGWQLIAYGRAINPPFVPRDARWLYPKTPLIQSLEAQGAVNGTRPGRILPIRASQKASWTPPILYAAESVTFGIDSAAGYDSTLPARAETVLRVLAGEDLEAVLAQTYRRAFVTSFEIDRVRFGLVPRLGITMIVAPPGLSATASWNAGRYAPLDLHSTYTGTDGEAFVVTGESGGPWLVHRAIEAGSPAEAARLFLADGFDHTRNVILEDGDDVLDAAPTDAGTTAAVPVSAVEDGINTLRLTVKTDQPGWVVVPIVWERGWSARVNSAPAALRRADYVFQAVPVAAGSSTVELEYRPPGLYAGLASSTAGVAGAIVLVFAARRRPR